MAIPSSSTDEARERDNATDRADLQKQTDAELRRRVVGDLLDAATGYRWAAETAAEIAQAKSELAKVIKAKARRLTRAELIELDIEARRDAEDGYGKHYRLEEELDDLRKHIEKLKTS